VPHQPFIQEEDGPARDDPRGEPHGRLAAAADGAAADTFATTPPVTGVANGANTGTKVELRTSYLALIAGLLAYYHPDDEFLLEAGVMTRDQLIAEFQQFVALAEATKTSNLAWRTDVQAERAGEQEVAPKRAGLKAILTGRFGKSGTTMTKFGFEPAKPGVKTPLVKTTAAVKARATRAARSTKGSVQRQEVTGNVTGVVVTPVTTGTPEPPVTAPVTTGTPGPQVAAPLAPAPKPATSS
jgi:hypothetical protein